MITTFTLLPDLIGTIPLLVPLEAISFTDWVNQQAGEVEKSLKYVVAIAVTLLFVVQVVKSKFHIGTIIIAAAVSGFVWWIVHNGGISFIASLFDAQA